MITGNSSCENLFIQTPGDLLLGRCRLHDRVQVTDATVGKDNQVAIAVHIAGLNEPGLARPLVGRRWFVIKWHRDVIDARIFRIRIIGTAQQLLNRRTNPGFPAGSEWGQSINPCFRILLGSGFGGSRNLRPASILLQEQVGAYVEVAEIGSALEALRACA